MELRIQNSEQVSKTAIVTGAARGIGAAFAKRLAQDSFNLVLVDLDTIVISFAESLPSARGLVMDVGLKSAARSITDFAMSEWGSIDALINNAASPGSSGSVEQLNRQDLRALFDVNVFALTDLCREATPILVERGGVIVNVGSLFGDHPVPNGAAYSMSKSAVKNLTQVLALELGPRGVRVNAIAPGYILTEMHLMEVAVQAESRHMEF